MKVIIHSEAISQNIIGDSGDRPIYLYLPPSYATSKKSYPVVYYLDGYGASPEDLLERNRNKLDELFLSGKKEFILVGTDGINKTGGSYYVNSPISGKWEDYITGELVDYIDTNFRTIADRSSRAIAGCSMGGFGALNLSMRHPEVYSSVLAFCPALFVEQELEQVLASWNDRYDVLASYAQAFSPDTGNKEDFGNIIKASDIKEKNEVWKNWISGFSNWEQKLKHYLTLSHSLKSILIAYSWEDPYRWIPEGCSYLISQFREKNIPYTVDHYKGGHIVPEDAIEKYMIPFFNRNLNYEIE
jgi:Predicted esterase